MASIVIESFKQYLLKKKQVSKITLKNYVADVGQFIRWYEETYKKPFAPVMITDVHVNTYIDGRNLSQFSRTRHISSLRTFFTFLKKEKLIIDHPLPTDREKKLAKGDPWRINEFAYYLSVYNASENTIKYYSLDVKQFLRWVKKRVAPEEKTLYGQSALISDTVLIDAYKTYLADESGNSFASINRKCTAIRRYVTWIQNQNLALATLVEQ